LQWNFRENGLTEQLQAVKHHRSQNQDEKKIYPVDH